MAFVAEGWSALRLQWALARRALQRAAVLLLGCLLLAGSCATAPPAPRAEILWDEWGVPHIYARSDEDLYYAIGWASMRNHATLLLRHYGQARGRAAEYWGESYLESDIQVHTLRIPQRAEAWLALQSPQFQAKLEAFAAGVNAYARAYPERISEESARVLPIRVVDILAHQQRAGVQPLAFAAIGREVAQWSERGSNAWAIGPERSASGNAMLILNPHIPWGEEVFGGLFRIFEVDAKSPTVDFYGGLQIGMPFPPGGLSDHHAIAGTVSTLDDADIYELTLAEGGYLFDGTVRAFEEETVSIGVRGENGNIERRERRIRWSAHGPVIAEQATRALAVRLAGIELPFQMEQFWDMARADSVAAFRDAIRTMQMPKQNLVYADRDGHIFYIATGRIPARITGDYAFWAGIVPGDTSATLWSDTLDIGSLPQTIDPPSGWLQNANEPPWYVTHPATFAPEDFPAWMSPRFLTLRSQRSLRMITEANLIDFDTMRASKLSTRSELADRVLEPLLAAARARDGARLQEAADVLERWDRQTNAHSRGAVLFLAWADLFSSEGGGYARAWSEEAPRTTPSGLADPDRAVALLDRVAETTLARYGALDVPFGDVYRLRWAGGIDLPANGASGRYGVFRVTDYLPTEDGRFRAFQGDSFVMLVEYSDPIRAEVLLSYGNASEPGSPHNGDQLRLYSQGQLRPVWRTRPEIEAHLVEREVLQ